MTVAKNIEVSATSNVSFEDAMRIGVAEVSKSVNNVQGAWVKEQKISISNDEITSFHVIMIVSFVIDNDSSNDKSKAKSKKGGKIFGKKNRK